MKSAAVKHHPSTRGSGVRVAHGIENSRAAREKAELALTPAERLTLALELSDLCADLAAAGQRALREPE